MNVGAAFASANTARAAGAGVSIENLSKNYGGAVKAVDGISLDVNPGEFVSILGPSGSGKTTLLMMIAGFEVPTSGRLFIAGRNMTAASPNKRDLGMVFQRYALFPHMTVADNIAYPLRRRGVARLEIRKRVEEALKLVNLEGFSDRMPAALSGGQQQRVAVARALIFEPPVMLMDEPLSALDKKLREQMQLEIKRLHRTVGVTIIYVTHDQEEALSLSDRIVVMNRGRIEQVGTPDELYNAPSSAFVADFIGRTSFLKADCVSLDDAMAGIRFPAGTELTLARRQLFGVAAVGPVRLAIRPEGARIVSGEPAHIVGTLEGARFVGSSEVAFFRLDTGESLQVQARPEEMRRLPVGSRAIIALAPARAIVFPEAT